VKKKLLSLMSVFLFFTHATNTNEQSFIPPQKSAQIWINTTIASITPADAQKIANILYLLYANTLIDAKIREFIIPFTKIQQSIRTHISLYTNPSQELALLKTLIERFTILTGAREIYKHTLEQCQNECTEPSVIAALEQLQQYGQKSLTLLMQEELHNTNKAIVCSINEMEKSIRHLNHIITFYKQLDQATDEQVSTSFDNGIMAVDAIIKNHTEIMPYTLHANTVVETLYDFNLAHILSIATEIYKSYYEALYRHNTHNNYENRVLFSMYGRLSEENTTLLPHPDHAMEHILQTVKLYTHIELLH